MKIVKRVFRNDLTSVLLPLITLSVVLSVSSKGFLSAYNLNSLMQSVSIYLLAGLAQMSALALGQFNLAVGSIACLSSILMGFCMQNLGMHIVPALFVCLITAALAGLIQGELIARSGINPFIITLALLSVYKGIGTVVSGGVPFSKLPDGIKAFNRANIGIVPVSFLTALGVCLIIFVLFRYLPLGQRIQAVGANPKAAGFSGIPVARTTVIAHTLSGLLCGVGAIIQTARFGSAQISVGDDWMMTSFVVAVLGGTLLSGGKVSTIGTLLGSFLMVFINNALVLWRVNTYAFQAILGLVLLMAYEIDRGRVAIIRRQSILEGEKEP